MIKEPIMCELQWSGHAAGRPAAVGFVQYHDGMVNASCEACMRRVDQNDNETAITLEEGYPLWVLQMVHRS